MRGTVTPIRTPPFLVANSDHPLAPPMKRHHDRCDDCGREITWVVRPLVGPDVPIVCGECGRRRWRSRRRAS